MTYRTLNITWNNWEPFSDNNDCDCPFSEYDYTDIKGHRHYFCALAEGLAIEDLKECPIVARGPISTTNNGEDKFYGYSVSY